MWIMHDSLPIWKKVRKNVKAEVNKVLKGKDMDILNLNVVNAILAKKLDLLVKVVSVHLVERYILING